MSNVKKILINGNLPFDCYSNVGLMPYLAALNGPSFGLRIQWGKGEMIPNKNGGKTATYDFTILGEEAVRFEWYDRLIKNIFSAGGNVKSSTIKDIENT